VLTLDHAPLIHSTLQLALRNLGLARMLNPVASPQQG
jgi:phosphotransferase system enzyme I (PtsP)